MEATSCRIDTKTHPAHITYNRTIQTLRVIIITTLSITSSTRANGRNNSNLVPLPNHHPAVPLLGRDIHILEIHGHEARGQHPLPYTGVPLLQRGEQVGEGHRRGEALRLAARAVAHGGEVEDCEVAGGRHGEGLLRVRGEDYICESFCFFALAGDQSRCGRGSKKVWVELEASEILVIKETSIGVQIVVLKFYTSFPATESRGWDSE